MKYFPPPSNLEIACIVFIGLFIIITVYTDLLWNLFKFLTKSRSRIIISFLLQNSKILDNVTIQFLPMPLHLYSSANDPTQYRN